MTDQDKVVAYFSRKGEQWARSGPVETYLRNRGKEGLAGEFRNDPDFRVVCEYAQRAGELQLRSDVTKSLEELVGITFGLPFIGSLDIIIAAIEEVCGNRFLAFRLIKGGLILLVIAGVGKYLSS